MRFASYKKILSFCLKFIVSTGLLLFILKTQVNYAELQKVFSIINPWLILLAFLMRFLGLYLSASRWRILLESMNIKIKLKPLMDSYLISFFFNTFLPTRIGGDIIRVSDLRKASKSLNKSASIVMVERFLGISCLFVFALVASLFRIQLAKEIPAIWIGLLLGFIGLVTFIIIFQFHILDRILNILPLFGLMDWLANIWNKFQNNVNELLSQKKTLLRGIYYSFLLQLNVVINYIIIGEAFGFEIPPLDYFFLIPIQLFILMLPSINGIGLRELSNIMLFAPYGVSSTEAVSFGFIEYIILLAIGSIGGFRFVMRKSLPEDIQNT